MVEKIHNLPKNDAIKKAEDLAKSLEKHGLNWHWQNNRIIFNVENGIASGTTGELILYDNKTIVLIWKIPNNLFLFKDFFITKIVNQLDLNFTSKFPSDSSIFKTSL